MKTNGRKSIRYALLCIAMLLVVGTVTVQQVMTYKQTSFIYDLDCIWSDSQLVLQFPVSTRTTSGTYAQWIEAMSQFRQYADTDALDITASPLCFVVSVSQSGTVCESTTRLPYAARFHPTEDAIYVLFRENGAKRALKLEQARLVESPRSYEEIAAKEPQSYTEMLHQRGWRAGQIDLPRRAGDQFTLQAPNCLEGVAVRMECLEAASKDGVDNGFHLTVAVTNGPTMEIIVANDGSWQIKEDGRLVNQGRLPTAPRADSL